MTSEEVGCLDEEDCGASWLTLSRPAYTLEAVIFSSVMGGMMNLLGCSQVSNAGLL